MSEEKPLPVGFESLARFSDWCLPTTQQRWMKRCESPMEELQEFYYVMLKEADRILDYLDDFNLHDLPEPEENLFLMMLSLSNVSMAVELHGMPRAPYSPWPHGIKLLEGVAPYGS